MVFLLKESMDSVHPEMLWRYKPDCFSIPSVSVPCSKVRVLCAKQTCTTSWFSRKGEPNQAYYFYYVFLSEVEIMFYI